MNARSFVLLALLVVLATGAQAVYAQVSSAPQPPIFNFEVLFSIAPPNGVSYGFPALRDGDMASDGAFTGKGRVVASVIKPQTPQLYRYLLEKFGPVPLDSTADSNITDYGLDAYYELQLPIYPVPAAFAPVTLFSVKTGFHSTTLNVDIRPGDVLSSDGKVFASVVPPQPSDKYIYLLANFGPMPIVGDMGVDAVFIPFYMPTAANPLPPEIWFSTNKGWFDEKLGKYISGGDLLSSRGYVVARNQQLLRNFLIYPQYIDPTQPGLMDMGLDAVYLPRFRPWVTTDAATAAASGAVPPPEIWFSVNKGFTDRFGRQISDGDLLSTSGAVVRTNAELLKNYPNPLMSPVLLNYGLDAVFVHGRNLVKIDPPRTTVPKVSGNVVRLVFDGPVDLPDGSPLNVTSQTVSGGALAAGNPAGSTFNVSVATTNADTPGDTLVLTEVGQAIPATSPDTVLPSDALNVDPFSVALVKLVGDSDGDGSVNLGDLKLLVAGWNKVQASPGFNTYTDLDNDGAVGLSDLKLLVANWGK